MKKLFILFGMIIFCALLSSCDEVNTGKLIIKSYENISDKTLPATIFKIELNSNYNIDENYSFKMYYGNVNAYADSPIDDNYQRITILSIKNITDLSNTNATEYELFEVHNIMCYKKYLVTTILDDKGYATDYIFNSNVDLRIPKEVITHSNGKLKLSLITYSVINGEIKKETNFEGSVCYLDYIIEGEKIIFKMGK